MGYLAIVIDGMEREQNKTKEDRGLFSTEFYRRLDKDIGTQLVKLLEDRKRCFTCQSSTGVTAQCPSAYDLEQWQ